MAKTEGSATHYFHQDHLSNRVVTDNTGVVAEQKGHYPYGEVWYEGATNPTKLKFTSYERDAESGNDFAIFRTHLNRFGRFNRPDPVAGNIFNPQRLNRYGYVLNDPVNLADPFGLDEGDFFRFANGIVLQQIVVRGTADGIRLDPQSFYNSIGNSMPHQLLARAALVATWLDMRDQGRDRPLRALPQKQLKALSDCVKSIFGVELTSFTPSGRSQNGSFSGTRDGKQLTITNDVNTFSVRDLNVITFGQPTPQEGRFDIEGYTADGRRATKYFLGIGYAYRRFSPYTNYAGRDLSPAALLSTQIHELGHSLAWILGLAPPNAEDPYGGKLIDCFNQGGPK